MPAFESVITLLVYENIPAAHAFLVDVFGFAPGGVECDPDGNPVHGEVRAGGSAFWLHRVAPEHGMLSAAMLGGANGAAYVLVDDVDAHFERTRSRGAKIENEPRNQPYGMREYEVRDIEGRRWWFAGRLAPTKSG